MPQPVRLTDVGTVNCMDATRHAAQVVIENDPVFSIATGSGAISVSVAPGAIFRLLRVELKLASASTDSETFTVTMNAGDSAEYDVVLHSENLTTGSITSLVVPFGVGYEFEADDSIDLAYTNTSALTYGLRVAYELL